MRYHLFSVALFVGATACCGGCALTTPPSADGIPVRRLPDEVLYNSAYQTPQDSVPLAANKGVSIRPTKAEMPVLPDPDCAPGAVFYTGGALGSGQYPLKGELRITEAVAGARGPLPACGGRVNVLRRLSTSQQLNIRVDLDDALRDPRENIPVWPGDTIILQPAAR